jgi:DNA polymerase III alpha subunit
METEFIEVLEVVENLEPEDVYDIEVDEFHTFFANGLLAHNCIAGYPAKIVFDNQKEADHKLWMPNDDNTEEIQKELALMIEEFQAALGKENYYLEMQFNRLGSQHLVNKHLIEASKRTGCPLVVTCDAHYSDPAHWREREIYKMMGMLQFIKPEDGRKPIPQSADELKCELYPKNADQVWDSYKEYCRDFDFYDDIIVKEAIERTHDIAHQQIGNAQPDRRVKLPAIQRIVEPDELKRLKEELGPEATDEDLLAFKEVKKLAIEGLMFRKVHKKQEYIDRLKYELEVIKTLKFAKYFLTYYQIMKIAGEHMLIGNARGCFLPGTRVKMADGMLAPIESIQIGEHVVDAYGETQVVENTLTYDCNENVIELEFDDGKIIRCTKDHKILTTNRGWVEAENLTEDDDIKEV